MYSTVAYQVASTISIKNSRNSLDWKLLFQDSVELFYELSNNKFIYIFQYGMVSFFNMTNNEIENALKLIKPNSTNYFSEKISEEVNIVLKQDVLQVNFENVVLPHLDAEMVRLVMLNASQSVALNRYAEITEEILIETNEHTKYLETKGKRDISGIK